MLFAKVLPVISDENLVESMALLHPYRPQRSHGVELPDLAYVIDVDRAAVETDVIVRAQAENVFGNVGAVVRYA